VPGLGHAESACTDDLADRIASWVEEATAQPVIPAGEIIRPAEPALGASNPSAPDAAA